MSDVYVSPTGCGAKDGSSALNALPVTSLDKAVQLAGPGGNVYMLADQGDYNVTAPINLCHGGTSSAPTTVMGVNSDGSAADIHINGTRPVVYSPANDPGNETFKLLAGADNLVFMNMEFSNVASAFRVCADVSNLTIENMSASNVKRFFEDYANGSNTSATISGLTIQDVSVVGFSKSVIRLQYDSHDVLIENVFGDSLHEDGDGIAEGVAIEGTVHDVMIRHATMQNAVSTSDTYWNGDGFTTERGTYNITFEDTLARGNADGGYDLKSTNTILTRAVAEGNGRNFRIWGSATLNDCIGIDPHFQGGTEGTQDQIQIMKGSKVTVNGGEFIDSGSSTYVVLNDGGGTIHFNGTHFIYAGGAHLTLGASISGIDPSNVTVVLAEGKFSSNGADFLANGVYGNWGAELPGNGTGNGSNPSGSGITPPTSGNGILGDVGDDIFSGTAGADRFDMSQGGTDTVHALGGRDVIYYGNALDSSDRNDGGDSGGDARGDLLVIQGNYDLTLGAGSLVNIEKFRVLKGSNSSFGETGGNLYSYKINSVDANVAAGDRLVVQGGSLQLGEHLTFDGSSESDGSFQMFGGHDSDTLIGGAQSDHLLGHGGDDALYGNGGDDRLRGGLGADFLDGGAGADTFVYSAQGGSEGYANAASESTGTAYDTIQGFTFGSDVIDLPQLVSSLASVTAGSLNDASFNGDLAAAVDGALQANGAVLFTPDAGGHAGDMFLVVDADGNGAFDAGFDFVIHLQGSAGTVPTAPDFFI